MFILSVSYNTRWTDLREKDKEKKFTFSKEVWLGKEKYLKLSHLQ